MFFLPAELAKEAGNEVLSHWMENLGMSQEVSFTLGHANQFSFLAGQCNSFVRSLREKQHFYLFYLFNSQLPSYAT